jgi:adenylate cyclase class 2
MQPSTERPFVDRGGCDRPAAASGFPRRNIELKARDPDPTVSLEACRALGADDHGDIWQRDTYFNVTNGGLKLREESPGRPHLIQFVRASEPQQRESQYRIIEVDDSGALRAALTETIGRQGVVEKRRRLFLWLEAVAPADSDLTAEHALIEELRARLSITDDRLLALGYAELLCTGAASRT